MFLVCSSIRQMCKREKWAQFHQYLKYQSRGVSNIDVDKASELKKKLQTQIEERKFSKYQSGHRLTNDEILSLFASFHENNKPAEDEKFNHMLSQPLLRVFGFERREFIEGCKQIAKAIGDAVSSSRFRAYIKGAIHSCPESEMLQSVSTPEAYKKIQELGLPIELNNYLENHLLTKLAVSLFRIPSPSYSLISREFFFRRIEQTSIKVLLGQKASSDATETSQLSEVENPPSSLDPSAPFKLEMTACIRYQVQSSYRLNVDGELGFSESFTRHEQSDWYFLYLRSYLTDYEDQEWKITQILNEKEYYFSRVRGDT